MRGPSLSTLVGLACIVLLAPGCTCMWQCISPAPPGPATAHQGVVQIARQDNPSRVIAFVSFDPGNAMHSWWLVRSGEQVLPLQTMVSGVPVVPHDILAWMPVSDQFVTGSELCAQFRMQLIDPANPSQVPMLLDVVEMQTVQDCH